jgi:hypothetical protein
MRTKEIGVVINVMLLIALASCLNSNVNSSDFPAEFLGRKTIEYIGKDTAVIQFSDSKRNQTDLAIKWIDTEKGEYSRIGPVVSITVKENGIEINTVPQMNLRAIEDIDFKSCQLYRTSGGNYVVSLAWGVGESLSVANDIHLIRINSR